ncbi:MAG: PAS domain S-box protein [Burkholderiales bacterium]|nr:PAS domain S-box protein [Burkholderiales bacterium]
MVGTLQGSEFVSEMRRRAEAILRRNDNSFRVLFDLSPTAMIVVDPDSMCIVRTNSMASHLFGYSQEELLGRAIEELTYPGDPVVTRENMKELEKGSAGIPVLEKRYMKSDGSFFWAQISFSVIGEEGGKAELFLGSLIDITARKIEEEKVRASRAFYRMAGQSARLGAWILELPSRRLICSDEVCEILEVPLGFSPTLEEAIGFYVPELREEVREVADRCISEGIAFDREWQLVNAKEKLLSVRAIGEAIRDDSGNICRLQGAFQDITSVVEVNRKLVETEATHRALFEHMLNGQAYCRMLYEEGRPVDFVYLQTNSAFEALTGLKDVVGKRVSEVIPGIRESDPELFEIYGRVALSGNPEKFETHVKSLDEWFWISVYCPKQDHFVAIFDVITARKRNEKRIAEYVKQLETSMEGTLLAISNMIEKRDPYTAGHEQRVGIIAADIAREMGWPEEKCRELQLIGLVHDIGKIAVPAEILTKPGRLSRIEYDLAKVHVEQGYEILKDVEFPLPIAEIIRQHHERMDGSGYPRGLAGDEILPEARILAVADVVESMASHRPYRPALGLDVAIGEISANRAIKYDAAVVDALLGMVNRKGYRLPG